MATVMINGSLLIDLNVLVSDSIRDKIYYQIYLQKIMDVLHNLFDRYSIPLQLSAYYHEWHLPSLDDPLIREVEEEYGKIENINGGEEDAFRQKTHLALLLRKAVMLSGLPGDIFVGFVGGRYSNLGGICHKPNKLIIVTTSGLSFREDALAFAHELFHCFGLKHRYSGKSVMRDPRSGEAEILLDDTDAEVLKQRIADMISEIRTSSK